MPFVRQLRRAEPSALATPRAAAASRRSLWFCYRAIEIQGGKHEIGFTQHVSSVLGRNGRDAANTAP
jgi:hypothetical protein